MAGARIRRHGRVHGHGGHDHTPTLRVLHVIIDGAGAELEPGIAADAFIDFKCEVVKWTLLADEAGNIEIDIWRAALADYPPDAGGTITAADLPTLSSAASATDETLTGWTTAIAAGDCLRFNIDSVSAIQRVVLALTLETKGPE